MCTRRAAPNILICGTPGVGKSSIAKMLEENTGLQWIDVSAEALSADCLEEYDYEFQCGVLDEEEVTEMLEERMNMGGNIVDYHSADLFPKHWFDIVFVLRSDNTVLYDRLQKRGYNEKKLRNNIECEILQVIVQEARDYFGPIVYELTNDNSDDLQNNVDRIYQWIQQWKIDNNQM